MGEIYRADDLRLGQTVALKFLPALRGRNPEDLAQLHREVRIARQISHPNVCRVFDIGDSDGVPFLTMEFVDGEDLATKRIDEWDVPDFSGLPRRFGRDRRRLAVLWRHIGG